MHHQQDMRHMGGLWRKMPITYVVSLLGSLALIGAPFFSGFYSKDMIIEAVKASNLLSAEVIYFMLLAGVFITAFYSFRMFFLVFHGQARYDAHHHDPHESPWVVTGPLIALAIPSVVLGAIAIGPFLFGGYFDGAIVVDPSHPAMAELASHYHGPFALALHAPFTPAFWLALSGVVVAAVFYLIAPAIPAAIQRAFSAVHRLLEEKYFLDRINETVFAGGARRIGSGLWTRADQGLIDGFLVNGSARMVGVFAGLMRLGQTGFLYHYAIAMILGVALMLWWFAPLLEASLPVAQ
jgi:NADH-quinone oxidoreductase subunit L